MAKQVTAAQPDSGEEPMGAAEKPTDEGPGGSGASEGGRQRDQTVIEVAIERALNDVRAEIEATSVEATSAEGTSAEGTSAEVAQAEAEKPDESGTPAANGGDASAHEEAEPQPVEEDARAGPADAGPKETPPADGPPADAAPDADILPADAQSADDMPTTEAAPAEAAQREAAQPIEPLTQMLARVTPPASLGELDEAVTAAGGPPMGQMVEDMIRPIVREWLANNLPSMVERIIREEIERVSRSGG